MSKGTKFFGKPKVRFSQNDNDLTKEFQDSNKLENVKQTNKPNILSNVKFDKNIRLLKLNESPISNVSNNPKIINNVEETSSSAVSSRTTKSSRSLNEHFIEENYTPLDDANNIQNIKANYKAIDTAKTSSSISDTGISIVPLVEQNRKIDKSVQSVKHNSNLRTKDSTKDKEGKENKTGAIKKIIKGSSKRSSDSEILKHKARLSSTNTKKSNLSNKTPLTIKTKKHVTSKSIAVDVMPCYKYNKASKKVKSPAVKKTIIRNIIGPKIRPYVGPGVLHEKESDTNFSEADNTTNVKPVISGDKLARPEYNSIMCTINKLNEVKKQKIVPDFDHLPPMYKNLINEKVSSALDFPLDEVIYKNLVDLSIDENQLPSRLTRSKDPEPRQKDIVPVLSDFFTPVFSEEYRIAVLPKPRITEATNNWNAFRISDQISEWRHTLDHM